MERKTKILFLASNPKDTTSLALTEEVRDITSRIRASKHYDALELTSRWAVRPDDLLEELTFESPAIVHFSGHGNHAGELLLTGDLGQAQPVSPSALKKLFETVGRDVRLVVLNACFSKRQAHAIKEAVGCAVGMNWSVGDTAAIDFAAAFYRAIGAGRSVKDAFEQGKASLELQGRPDANVPELLVRDDIDASKVFLIQASPSDFVNSIFGDWWGKVSTKEHESTLACIRIENPVESGVASLTGRSFASNGEFVAKWRSVFAHVAGRTDRNCIEFKYLFEGERHDKPGMTLLFGSADVTFEVPAIPGNPVRRGESTFVSVYKAAKATNESWGKAKQRTQTLVRAEDTFAFQQLWTAAHPAQCEPLVQKVVDAVFGRCAVPDYLTPGVNGEDRSK